MAIYSLGRPCFSSWTLYTRWKKTLEKKECIFLERKLFNTIFGRYKDNKASERERERERERGRGFHLEKGGGV